MRRILVHFDTDLAPSVFDRVVAIDADIDELFSYGGISPENVEPLVHGAIFTRGPADLKNTAIFIGGSHVEVGERLAQRVKKTFFGPMRVSVMIDSNGSSTTAAAAVLAARKHVALKGTTALVLGGAGPVGQRAAQLIAREGGTVLLASRSKERAQAAAQSIAGVVAGSQVIPVSLDDFGSAAKINVLIAAAAAGAQLLSASQWRALPGLQVAIDLNAVPPAGLEGIEVGDKGKSRDGVTCYGAIGVGGTKMKIHKACLARLFESNDQFLDVDAIYEVGATITADSH